MGEEVVFFSLSIKLMSLHLYRLLSLEVELLNVVVEFELLIYM
jgi:hypothetical protein